MSKVSASLGNGLGSELTAIKLRMPAARAPVTPIVAAPAPAPAAPKRRVLTFKPKVPAVAKTGAKKSGGGGGAPRLVVKVDVKSKFLRRKLGLPPVATAAA